MIQDSSSSLGLEVTRLRHRQIGSGLIDAIAIETQIEVGLPSKVIYFSQH